MSCCKSPGGVWNLRLRNPSQAKLDCTCSSSLPTHAFLRFLNHVNAPTGATCFEMAVMASPASPLGLTSPHRTPNRAPMPPNVSNVMLGNLHIKPWYPSFYPEDMMGGRRVDWLYVCQWCFKYTHEIMKYSAHCVCISKHVG